MKPMTVAAVVALLIPSVGLAQEADADQAPRSPVDVTSTTAMAPPSATDTSEFVVRFESSDSRYTFVTSVDGGEPCTTPCALKVTSGRHHVTARGHSLIEQDLEIPVGTPRVLIDPRRQTMGVPPRPDSRPTSLSLLPRQEPPEERLDSVRAIPFGYHAEKRPRIGLMVSGSIVFSATYGMSAYGAAALDIGALYVPILGPLIEAGIVAAAPCGWFCGLRPLTIAMFIADGLAQAAGLAMLIGGAVAGRTVLVADRPGIVAVMPITTPGGAGIGMLARF